jgi:hypothetical protein
MGWFERKQQYFKIGQLFNIADFLIPLKCRGFCCEQKQLQIITMQTIKSQTCKLFTKKESLMFI